MSALAANFPVGIAIIGAVLCVVLIVLIVANAFDKTGRDIDEDNE